MVGKIIQEAMDNVDRTLSAMIREVIKKEEGIETPENPIELAKFLADNPRYELKSMRDNTCSKYEYGFSINGVLKGVVTYTIGDFRDSLYKIETKYN